MTHIADQLRRAIVRHPLCVELNTRVVEAIAQISQVNDIGNTNQPTLGLPVGCAVVVDNDQVVGLLTERDIVRLATQQLLGAELTLQQVLGHPPITVRESTLTDLGSVLNIFEQHQVSHLPILDDQDRLVGLISPESLQQALSSIALQQTATYEQLQAELVARQQTEAQLRNSERRYASLVAASPVGILHSDLEGICTYANERYCEIVGCELAALIGQPWHLGYKPEDVERISQAFEQSLRENSPFQVEYSFHRPDGAVVWIYGQAVVEYDAAGQAIGYVGTITDISDRKRAESLLELQYQILERIARAEPLAEIFRALLTTMESCLPETVCSIMLCQDGQLCHATAPSLPDDSVDSFVLPIAEGAGTCGTAAYRRELVIVTDVETDPICRDYKPMASILGLQSGWAIPILDRHQDVLGVFGMHYREPKVPSLQEIECVKKLANLTGVAIEREQATQTLIQLNQDLESRVAERTAALQASEERWQLALQGANDGIWDWDPQTDQLFLSQRMQEMLGFGADERIDSLKACLQLIHPEDRDRFARAIEEHLSGTSEFFEIEYRLQHKNGSYVWLLSRAQAQRNALGQAVRMIGSKTDITQRKLAELALEESERRYASLAAAAPVAIFRFDPQIHCTYVNHRWCEMTGRSAESALGQGWIEALHPEDCHHAVAALEELRQHTSPDSRFLKIGEGRHLRPDGSINWFYSRVVQEFDDAGNVIGYIGTLTDITDRKIAELALKESEQRYASLAAAAPVAIFRFDEPLNCVYVNDRWSEMTGRPVASAMGQGWLQALHPDDREQAITAWTEAYIRTVPGDLPLRGAEGRHLRPDGTVNWFYAQVAQEFDHDGNVVGYVGTLTDISDRKKLEQEQATLTTILEATPDYIAMANTHGEILWHNKQLRDLRPDLCNRDERHGISDYHPDWANKIILEQAIPTAIQEGSWSGELALLDETGGEIPVSQVIIVHKSADGTVENFSTIMRDISDLKRSEQQLLELSERLNLAIQSAQIGIWQWDYQSLRLSWDDRMLAIYGIQPEDFQGTYQDWEYRVDPDDRAQAQPEILPGQRFYKTEFRVIGSDGTIRHIMSTALVQQNDQGELLRAVGVNIDISDRKQAELQLQCTNEELIRATRLKDEFLANMSHELRTPLNAILGMSEALQEEVFGQLNERQIRSLKIIQDSGTHLLELINDILDVAKIESGHINLDLQSIDITRICHSSITFIKQQAQNKRIRLETRIPHTLPRLLIDERRILQILINLLNNAVKFTPAGGQITLEASYHHHEDLKTSDVRDVADEHQNWGLLSQEISLLEAGSYVKISITDTGIGIAPEDISRLFQPFVQIDSALNRQYAGTGLGLALVKRITELHGGVVQLTSEIGVGSCFSIKIPYDPSLAISEEIHPSDIGDQPNPSLPVQTATSQLILLAEDNETNISMLVSYLESYGYRLIVAHNGLEALSLAKTHQPTLILMDVQMPEMDGLEAIQRIRQDTQIQKIPIIALTALAMKGDEERCLSAGANSYLSKPVRLKALKESVQQLIEEHC